MKKTLIALAALAAFGSASAQFAVKGNFDIGVISSKTDGTADAGLAVKGGGYATNTLNFQAGTDIGGGLKGFGEFELGFYPTNDNGLGGSWTRVGKVGLTGGFGTIALGNDWSPFDYAIIDSMDAQHISAYAAAWNSSQNLHGDNGNTGPNGSGSVNGSIIYHSPEVGGLSFYGQYAPKKNPDPVTAAANGVDANYYSFNVAYNAGPLSVAAATEHVATVIGQNAGASAILANLGVAAPTGGNTDAWVINGSYDLTAVKLFGGVTGGTINLLNAAGGSNSAKETGYQLGLSAPAGKATVAAGYALKKTTVDGVNGDQTLSSFGAQVLYPLNKVGTVYAGGYKLTNKTTSIADANTTYLTAGLRFTF
jgi:predicted porin